MALFFKRIYDLRVDNDLLQRDIAKILNVNKNTYPHWEKGMYEIPIDIIDKLANFYNVSIDYITGLSDDKGSFGKSVRYKLYPNYIEVFGRAKSITYSFLPSDFALSDEFEFYNGLSARIYAYGVASEYLLCDGLSEDAEIWEERFKESLFVLSRKKSETRLPKRRWI